MAGPVTGVIIGFDQTGQTGQTEHTCLFLLTQAEQSKFPRASAPRKFACPDIP